ncbi:MAG: non-ribosomal peptide synthetase, partial [bacterium]|nr:non-ribosomal peptide synthetase [bacterium]
LRVKLMETDEGIHMLMVDMHHIISDGVSMNLLKTDFNALYENNVLPPLRIQYKDFAQWRNSESETQNIREQESFWRNEFSGEIPVLQLPLDYPRPAVQSFEGSAFYFQLSGEDSRGLRAVALETGSTLFMVLLSLTAVLLSKLSGQEDIIIGTPIVGRRHDDLEKIMGMFVNTLPLRNYPGAGKTAKEFLHQVKERSLKAFENQEYQFDDLVEQLPIARNTGRNPLFDVLFIFNNIDDGPATGDAASAVVEEDGESRPRFPADGYEDRVAKFDLTIATMESGDRLFVGFQYCTRLFKEETIRQFMGYFKRIASSIAQTPDMKLSDIEIISPAIKDYQVKLRDTAINQDLVSVASKAHQIDLDFD